MQPKVIPKPRESISLSPVFLFPTFLFLWIKNDSAAFCRYPKDPHNAFFMLSKIMKPCPSRFQKSCTFSWKNYYYLSITVHMSLSILKQWTAIELYNYNIIIINYSEPLTLLCCSRFNWQLCGANEADSLPAPPGVSPTRQGFTPQKGEQRPAGNFQSQLMPPVSFFPSGRITICVQHGWVFG